MFFWFGKAYLGYRGRITSDELKQRVLQQIRFFRNKIESLSPEQLNVRKVSEKWNGSEITFHIFHATKRVLGICEELRQDHSYPDMERSAIGQTKDIPYPDLLEYCRKVDDLTSQFDFHSNSTKTCAHPFFGQRNFKQWLVLSLVHLERHYQQLLRVTQ
jgi:DinB superfamily